MSITKLDPIADDKEAIDSLRHIASQLLGVRTARIDADHFLGQTCDVWSSRLMVIAKYFDERNTPQSLAD